MEYCLKSDISIDALYLATTLSYGMARRFKQGELKCSILNHTDTFIYCIYNYCGKIYGFRVNNEVFRRIFKITVNEDWE